MRADSSFLSEDARRKRLLGIGNCTFLLVSHILDSLRIMQLFVISDWFNIFKFAKIIIRKVTYSTNYFLIQNINAILLIHYHFLQLLSVVPKGICFFFFKFTSPICFMSQIFDENFHEIFLSNVYSTLNEQWSWFSSVLKCRYDEEYLTWNVILGASKKIWMKTDAANLLGWGGDVVISCSLRSVRSRREFFLESFWVVG
jgi:hypothetical protein